MGELMLAWFFAGIIGIIIALHNLYRNVVLVAGWLPEHQWSYNEKLNWVLHDKNGSSIKSSVIISSVFLLVTGSLLFCLLRYPFFPKIKFMYETMDTLGLVILIGIILLAVANLALLPFARAQLRHDRTQAEWNVALR